MLVVGAGNVDVDVPQPRVFYVDAYILNVVDGGDGTAVGKVSEVDLRAIGATPRRAGYAVGQECPSRLSERCHAIDHDHLAGVGVAEGDSLMRPGT